MMPTTTENISEGSPLLGTGTQGGVVVPTTTASVAMDVESLPAASTVANNYQTTTTTTTTTTTSSDANGGIGKVNDEYIISLIRRTSTLNDDNDNNDGDNNNNNKAEIGIRADDDRDADADDDELHGTTYGQTVIHLVKGYIGCGILSLPWAVSQLGIPLGLLGIVLMSLWSSYNCWTVVKLKRFIERTTINIDRNHDDDDSDSSSDDSDEHDDNNSDAEDDNDDDDASKNSKMSRAASSVSVASSNVTYPDVGEWAHGVEFQKYVTICICAQQLAICTVFISFVGENLYATLKFLQVGQQFNRMVVTSFCMPAFLALSCFLPSLKSMSPFMLLGTVLMLSGFASLGLIGMLKWNDRPMLDELPTLKWDKNAPMALCGILYSFEGICIILPVESSMKYAKKKEFKSAFGVSMVLVTMMLCGMAAIGVLVFGEVSNGSITAFLLEEYKDDPNITFWLMLSNVLVSVSIIFSYPLQLFPAVELVAPIFYDWTVTLRRRRRQPQCWWWQQQKEDNISSNDDDDDDGEDEEDSLGYNANGDDEDLEGFERMAGIPEHDVASMGSLPSLPESTYHEYDVNNDTTKNNLNINNNHDGPIIDPSRKGIEVASSSSSFVLSSTDLIDDNETTKTGEATDGGGISESASLLSRLSSNISYQRSIVDDIDDDRSVNINSSERRNDRNRRDESAFEWTMPGDSPGLRAGLVIGTYLVGMVVPNVQSLVSLVGAVTGSSTALLIPPILELAWIRHMESREAGRQRNNLLLGDWEGGPSTASKRTLFGNTSSQHHHHHHHHSSTNTPKNKKRRRNKYLWNKILAWCMLIIGSIFALIGSYFSIRDIVQSYM